jgi:hypothetical protein
VPAPVSRRSSTFCTLISVDTMVMPRPTPASVIAASTTASGTAGVTSASAISPSAPAI